MQVDMSPQAITARLMLLNQLWELSVKLTEARKPEEPVVENSETALMSERSLAEEWMTPEEDAAWQHLRKLPTR